MSYTDKQSNISNSFTIIINQSALILNLAMTVGGICNQTKPDNLASYT